MDPGDIPEELQELTYWDRRNVVSVYCLWGGQYAYRGMERFWQKWNNSLIKKIDSNDISID